MLAACSIPDTRFNATPDGGGGGDGGSDVLAIVPSATSVDVDEGKTKDFTVRLSLAPSAPLTVQVATQLSKISLSAPELTFEPTNFDVPQTITVTALTDEDIVPDTGTIELTANAVDPVSVSATVADPDKVEIISDIIGGVVTINEAGAVQVKVHLSKQPSGDVSVSAILGAGPISVTPSSRVFTPENYDADQLFTFNSTDDANIVSEDIGLTFRATSVADSLAVVRNVDDDQLNIRLSRTSVGVTERGSVVIDVALTQQPPTDVVVQVVVANARVSVDKSSLTFTASNFGTNQSVTISAPDDIDTADASDTVRFEAGGITTQTVSVAVSDDDVQRIVVDNDNPPSPLPVTEGMTATFNVTLAFQPAADVVVSVTSLAGGVATATPGTLRFTPINFAVPQPVTVRGTADNNLATNVTTVRLSDGARQTDVSVSVSDVDVQKIVLNRTSLTVTEGQSGSFNVSLQFDPGTTVTVDVASNSAALPVNPASLTFTSANFGTPKAVNVNPPIDTNNIAETATITASGGGAPAPVTLAASVTDPTVVAQFGFPTPFPATASLLTDRVVAYRITVSESTNIDAFGVVIPAGSGDFRMALYAQGAGDQPGALVAQMPVRQAIANNPQGIQIGNITDLAISGPAVYWIAMRVAQTTAVGYANNPALMGRVCRRTTDITGLNTDWPLTYGNASCDQDFFMNFFINTYHQ